MTNTGVNNSVLNNDFTVTKSTPSATVTCLVSQENDSAGSTACEIISVSGATSSDVFTRYSIGSTNTFSTGIDNSDSDIFKITHDASASTPSSASVLLTATSAGEVNLPLQTSFFTKLSADIANVTGDGTAYTIAWDSEVWDIGANLAGSTFTAPITGKYLLGGNITIGGLNANSWSGKNYLFTSNGSFISKAYNIGAYRASSGIANDNFSVLAEMEAGDQAYIVAKWDNGTKILDIAISADIHSYFYGELSL
jgi:hypothetical protein